MTPLASGRATCYSYGPIRLRPHIVMALHDTAGIRPSHQSRLVVTEEENFHMALWQTYFFRHLFGARRRRTPRGQTESEGSVGEVSVRRVVGAP